ncbi:MAG: hypothetical protein WD118_01615 [Phycisphaeraceae bacterium]
MSISTLLSNVELQIHHDRMADAAASRTGLPETGRRLLAAWTRSHQPAVLDPAAVQQLNQTAHLSDFELVLGVASLISHGFIKSARTTRARR